LTAVALSVVAYVITRMNLSDGSVFGITDHTLALLAVAGAAAPLAAVNALSRTLLQATAATALLAVVLAGNFYYLPPAGVLAVAVLRHHRHCSLVAPIAQPDVILPEQIRRPAKAKRRDARMRHQRAACPGLVAISASAETSRDGVSMLVPSSQARSGDRQGRPTWQRSRLWGRARSAGGGGEAERMRPALRNWW
jgi:hypothetical protein